MAIVKSPANPAFLSIGPAGSHAGGSLLATVRVHHARGLVVGRRFCGLSEGVRFFVYGAAG